MVCLAANHFPGATSMRIRFYALLVLIVSLLSGCGYNQIQINDEGVNAA